MNSGNPRPPEAVSIVLPFPRAPCSLFWALLATPHTFYHDGKENQLQAWGSRRTITRHTKLPLTERATSYVKWNYPNDGVRVNDTVGHTTYRVCALKSHILQTRLTGHTTCETCALEVINRSVVRFFYKKTHHALGMWGQLDSFFLHLTPAQKLCGTISSF
jgi:hypothetical protein